MLFYGGLGKVQALCYLGVAETVGYEFQNFLLAKGKGREFVSISTRQHIFQHLSRGCNFALRSNQKGSDDLTGFHPRVYKPHSSGLQSGLRER